MNAYFQHSPYEAARDLNIYRGAEMLPNREVIRAGIAGRYGLQGQPQTIVADVLMGLASGQEWNAAFDEAVKAENRRNYSWLR